MQDYQSNSNKKKSEIEPKPKVVEQVTTKSARVQKKTIGRKFKELFIEADFKSVSQYVFIEVLLPAARNAIVDATSKGVERMMYGESVSRSRTIRASGPRITYNSPISRSAPTDPRNRYQRRSTNDISSNRRANHEVIISSREEAELVLDRMNDILDSYEAVSLSDLYELVGLPSNAHVDNKWGWISLGGVPIRQVREGYLIEFPPMEPL